MTRFAAVVVLLGLCVGIVAFVGLEVGAGARTFGERTYVDPCTAPADPFPQGEGLDGTLQRILLSGLNGAACELGTSREVLVLSLDPDTGFGDEVTWTEEELERALQAGLLRAVDDADERDTLPGFVASILRFAVERAPLDWLLGLVDLPFLED